MFALTSPLPRNGIETLAQAWLGAGATAVTLWDKQRLIRHWPAQDAPDKFDFTTPVRIGNERYGEMCVCGFSAPTQSRETHAASCTEPANVLAGNGLGPQRRDVPALPGLDLYVESHPCLEVGGDYYDFVCEPAGSLVFSVADISGKGLGAALLMPGMHRALRRSLQSVANATPADWLTWLNDDLYTTFASSGSFATALLGCYDPSARTITYANAGHSPVIYRRAGGQACLLQADSIPLGIDKQLDAIERTFTLGPDDLLIIGTDGLAEARNRSGQLFGYQPLLELADSLADQCAAGIGQALFEDVATFRGRARQNDDSTVMVLKGKHA